MSDGLDWLRVLKQLPRLGPGSARTTRLLLEMAATIPESARVIDIGCGLGSSTIVLAQETDAVITAVDSSTTFLEVLQERASAIPMISERILPRQMRMQAITYADQSFDLVWCEAAVYAIGFDRALSEWRRLLRPGGSLVVTDCVWLREPSPASKTFWQSAYPAMRSVGENLTAISSCGYSIKGLYVLPESDWWSEYYLPLEEQVLRLPSDAEAPHTRVLEEIALKRESPGDYGYVGYVAVRQDP